MTSNPKEVGHKGDGGDVLCVARQLGPLNHQAIAEYTPLVEEILRTNRRDTARIERTLDGLLDFCGHPPIVELYRRLCRYYWAINPEATASYVAAYREMWDTEGEDDAEVPR